MRVAIIITRLACLGPVKVIQALVNSLNNKDEDIEVSVFYLDKKVDPELKMLVPVEHFRLRSFCFSDYDIIHTSGIRPDLIAFLNRRKIRYHISTIHNFVFEDLSYTYNKLFSLIFGNIWLLSWKRADRLVCVTKTMKDYYLQWFSTAKMEVIYNGIPESVSHNEPDADVIQYIEKFHSNGFKVVGCSGILTKRKGFDQILYLIAAEAGLATVIIGDGKEIAKLKDLSEELHISDRCMFCGFRNNAQDFFKYFDSFIMPSRSEGFGLALIEAVQQKVPVICSDIGVFRELFTTDEVTFFKLEDIDSMSESVKSVIKTGSTKTEIAYKKFNKCYTAFTMAENYRRLYKSASLIQVA
jgi:glycosyltransferase involved in cell wall biosynthesis